MIQDITMDNEIRPWGSYIVLEEGNRYKIKRISVNPGEALSLQTHFHRSEHWVVIHGTADVELEGEHTTVFIGESVFVKSGIKHRLSNPGKIPLDVIEVSTGEYINEDDIIRYDDKYNRNTEETK